AAKEWWASAGTAAAHIAAARHAVSIRRITSPRVRRAAAKVSVDQLFRERHALELEHLRVLLDTPVERHAHLPRPRKHVGIFDRRFVLADVGARARDALGGVLGARAVGASAGE